MAVSDFTDLFMEMEEVEDTIKGWKERERSKRVG